MKEFAAKLLELDREAQSLMEEAAAYREASRADTQAQKDAMLREFEAHAAAHTEAVRQTEAQGAAQEAERLRRSYAALRQGLEDTYRTRHQHWEDELVRRCVERW